jgi:hypothetical protein
MRQSRKSGSVGAPGGNSRGDPTSIIRNQYWVLFVLVMLDVLTPMNSGPPIML